LEKYGDVESIAELAAQYFRETKRPLRIAVDLPYWWYKALPKDTEAEIKKSNSFSCSTL